MGPPPPVAEIRRAVRRVLAGLEPGDLVLAACSGGADSLALAAALAFEAPKQGLRAGGVTVDHGLQAGSAEQASRVERVLREIGLDPVLAVTAEVVARGSGPEAAARDARYAALDRAAARADATAILLGHTMDDQAETVLLGLARGSGARSLAGMAVRSGRYLRPLLAVSREQTAAACAALGLQAWQDPQNADPSFARVRVRTRVLPVLERELGPGVAQALARTAAQLRADADLLDELAEDYSERMTAAGPSLPAESLAALPTALRTRVLRTAAILAGCPPAALTWAHVLSLDALVTEWRGQRGADLPGGCRAVRRYGTLIFTRAVAGDGASPAEAGSGGSGGSGRADAGGVRAARSGTRTAEGGSGRD
jgi:tRNA(Ile)-lysidine synthase